jgi:hypothetical protein
MRQRLGALAVVSMLTMPGMAMGQEGAANMIDLTKPDILGAEFTLGRTGEGAAGEWTIVSDTTAQGGLAIAQVSKDRTDYRFPLAIYKPYSGTNLEASVRFKLVAGSVDQAGGIVVRLQTPDNYYIVRANASKTMCGFTGW